MLYVFFFLLKIGYHTYIALASRSMVTSVCVHAFFQRFVDWVLTCVLQIIKYGILPILILRRQRVYIACLKYIRNNTQYNNNKTLKKVPCSSYVRR